MRMKEPHQRLAHARELAGYETATEAADAMGARRPTYMGHENGSRGFKAEAERYARFFRVSFEWLATGRGEPRRESLDARVQALPAEEQRRVREFIEFIESRRPLRDVG
jgi:phage repressor protein C with HTH and peptisase S24 domain